LKYGVSGLNIDGGRIGTEIRKTKGVGGTETTMVKGAWGSGKGKDLEFEPTGRFPANIILDEEAARMLDEQSGVSKSIASGYNKDKGANSMFMGE